MEGGRKKKEDTRIKSLRISKGSFEPRVVNLSFPIEEKKGKKWSTSTGTCGGGTEEPAVELWRSFLFFLILPFRPILFAHHLASWLSVKKVSEHGGAGQVDNISDISPDRRWR